MNMVSASIFLKQPEEEVRKGLPGWERSGYWWKEFYEYVQSVPEEFPKAVFRQDLWVGGKNPLRVFPTVPQAGRSIVTVSHPVTKREDRGSMITTTSFHWFIGDGAVFPIVSDFPLAHVYEDVPIRRAERGLVSGIVELRQYEQHAGVWRGRRVGIIPASLSYILLVVMKGSVMYWDFLQPQTWHVLTMNMRDHLRLKGQEDGYVRVSSIGGTELTYVPPFWGLHDLRAAFPASDWTRDLTGWVEQKIPIEFPLEETHTVYFLVQRLIRQYTVSEVLGYLFSRGLMTRMWLIYFDQIDCKHDEKCQCSIRVEGRSDLTAGYFFKGQSGETKLEQCRRLMRDVEYYFEMKDGKVQRKS